MSLNNEKSGAVHKSTCGFPSGLAPRPASDGIGHVLEDANIDIVDGALFLGQLQQVVRWRLHAAPCKATPIQESGLW